MDLSQIPLKKVPNRHHLWPAVMAIGEGPFGARGSSQVLISTSTLSRNCGGWKKCA